MDKLLAYLLLALLVIIAWNEPLSSRFHRLIGTENPNQETAAMEAVSAPTPRRTPFWQQPGYKSSLEKAPISGKPDAAKKHDH